MTDGRADRLRSALRLYLLADTGLLPPPRLVEAVGQALRGGVTAVQLRAATATTVELLDLARMLKSVCEQANALFLVNSWVDVALAAEADGAHVGHIGSEDVSPQEARHVLGPNAVVGVSVASAQEARAATSQGASYVSAGPMFPPPSHVAPGQLVGEALLRSVRAATGLPLVVVGGVTAERAPALFAAGADGVCVGAAIMRAPDIQAAARAFFEAARGRT